ncbi:MAG: preprotein translocase subunit SecA [Chitinophagales bacterium]
MFGFVNKMLSVILGDKSAKDIKLINPVLQQIKAEYATLHDINNDELRGKTTVFQDRIAKHLASIDAEIGEIEKTTINNPDVTPEDKEERYKEIDKLRKKRDEELEVVLNEILPEAFAVVRETARRFTEATDEIRATATDLDRDLSVTHSNITIEGNEVVYQMKWLAAGGEVSWNMVHYDVQLVGGIVLHQGKISEMATGEGKTLVATLPAYLNGLTHQGVHIITVNDYLAKRDSEWMAPIFQFLGLTVDCIDKYRSHSDERKKAYRADITYGTNNEFGFDYLRDNMVRNPNELVQGKHHYAMVDEVDSVLIDDARTPLIISGPVEKGDEHQYDDLKPRIQRLYDAQKKLVSKYLIDAKKKIKEGNTGVEEGGGGLDLLRAFRGLPKYKPLIKFLSEPSSKVALQNTENFYLQEQSKRMPEVDSELYFVIEEKNNNVVLTEKGTEVMTEAGEESDFFVMPDIGGQMADIENAEMSKSERASAKDSLMQNFAVKSERLHSVNQLLKAYTLFEKDVEYVIMDNKVKIIDEQTGRMMDGRRYSDGLHQAIEAKENVKVEAATQTFATITLQNYFRMYHKLAGMTGTAETEAGEFWDIYKLDVVVIPTNRPIARNDDEDLVFRTQREKFNAVIEEIVSLSKQGRPILVGTASVETSELLSRMLRLRSIEHNVLNAKNHVREAEIVAQAGRAGQVTIATNMAGRGTDIKLGEGVKEAGGLAIVGTERHDARRIDRQLRGRAGRQGDPGSSQFYVSLEDNLMRLFMPERIAKIMDKMGYSEGEVIQHSMITKSIARAQKKVEENNFGIRKRLLDYDEVMNAQREGIYKKRRHALFGERLSVDLYNAFQDLSDEVLFESKGRDGDFQTFKQDVIRYFAIDVDIDKEEFERGGEEMLADKLYNQVAQAYKRKAESIMKQAKPFIDRLYHDKGKTYERVSFPFTDGSRGMTVVVNLEEAYNTDCRSLVRELEKTASLAFIDESWKTHLRQMDELKQSVQTAVYEQKDPLLIYKQEAYTLFKDMVVEMNKDLTSFLFKAMIPIQDSNQVQQAQQPRKTDMSRMKTGRDTSLDKGANAQRQAAESAGESTKPQTFRREQPKVGRNEPCPCGSGKKYKQCHGRSGIE